MFDLTVTNILDKEDFEQISKIEQQYFSSSQLISPEEGYKWYIHNKDTSVAIKDVLTGELVAFIILLPITDGLHDKIMSGDFEDNAISLDQIRRYENEGKYKLYLSSIAVNMKYNRSLALRMMLNEFANRFIDYADRNIFIDSIITDAVSQRAQDFCKAIGMHEVCQTVHNSKVYFGKSIMPFFRLFSSEARINLLKHYANE